MTSKVYECDDDYCYYFVFCQVFFEAKTKWCFQSFEFESKVLILQWRNAHEKPFVSVEKCFRFFSTFDCIPMVNKHQTIQNRWVEVMLPWDSFEPLYWQWKENSIKLGRTEFLRRLQWMPFICLVVDKICSKRTVLFHLLFAQIARRSHWNSKRFSLCFATFLCANEENKNKNECQSKT